MPTFEYQGLNSQGETVKGTAFGVSLDAVLASLSRTGLKIERIEAAQGVGDPLKVHETAGQDYREQRSYFETSIMGPLVGRVKLEHLLFFFQQFGTMQDAAVPLVQSLETLQRQAKDPKLAGIIGEMRMAAQEGAPLTAVFQRYPEVFSGVMVSVLRAGEDGGFFADALKQVAEYTRREIDLRNLYRRVTFYPKMQIAASILIIVAANLILTRVGSNEKLESPLTEPLTWVFLAPLIVGLFLFFRVGLANPRTKFQWDAIILSVPYLGKTIHQFAMAKFGRAFGAMHRAGVPLAKAVSLAADASGNESLRARIRSAAPRLESGESITDVFRSTGAFPEIVLDMTRTGETTGNIDFMLDKVSAYYEEDSATRATQFAMALGVALLLLVAVYIGYVIINFYVQHYSGVMNAADAG